MKQKRDKTVVLGIAILAGAILLQLILGFDPGSRRYERYVYSYYGNSDYRFSFLVFLPYLSEAAGAGYTLPLVFAHFLPNTEGEQKHRQTQKLWFLPGVLMAAKLPLSLLSLLMAHSSPALCMKHISNPSLPVKVSQAATKSAIPCHHKMRLNRAVLPALLVQIMAIIQKNIHVVTSFVGPSDFVGEYRGDSDFDSLTIIV